MNTYTIVLMLAFSFTNLYFQTTSTFNKVELKNNGRKKRKKKKKTQTELLK